MLRRVNGYHYKRIHVVASFDAATSCYAAAPKNTHHIYFVII
jgi:hypothetical protein